MGVYAGATGSWWNYTGGTETLRSYIATNKIVQSGLVLSLDSGVSSSYPGSGTTWSDLSGNGNTGTLTNGPTYNSSNGGSIVLDGIDDYVQVVGSIITSQATFIAWIKRNGDQSDYNGVIYSRGTSTTGLDFSGDLNPKNRVNYTWNGAFNTYSWDSGLTVPNLTWCMIAISVSSSSATAYLCQSTGITSSTNNVSHTSTTLDDIRIGQDNIGIRCFSGNISSALIYNRALSASEIQQNFNVIKPRYGL